MAFLVGEKVKNIMRGKVGTVIGSLPEKNFPKEVVAASICVDYGNGPEVSSLKYLALAVAKRTPFMHILATDPSALLIFADEFKAKHGIIRVYAALKHLDALSEQLSACCSALTPTTVADYIKVLPTDLSQGPKFSITMDNISQSLIDRLGCLVWSRTSSRRTNTVTINSRSLVEYLLREHTVIPALPESNW